MSFGQFVDVKFRDLVECQRTPALDDQLQDKQRPIHCLGAAFALMFLLQCDVFG